MKKFFYIICLCALFSNDVYGQKYDKDSLWGVWQNDSEEDTTRLRALNHYVWNFYLFVKTDSAMHFLQIQYDYAQKVNSLKFKGVASNSMGIASSILGDNNKAIEYFEETMAIDYKIGDIKGVSASFNNLGIIYKEQGRYSEAIDVYGKSLDLADSIGDKQGVGSALNNMGIVYELMRDSENALKNYKKTLIIRREEGDNEGISSCLNNIGIVYQNRKDLKTALKYYKESYSYKDTINDLSGISVSYNNFGTLYRDMGQYDKALYYLKKGHDIKLAIGDKKGVLMSLNGMGSVYYYLGNYKKSIELSSEALEIAKEIKVLELIKDVSRILYRSQKAIGNNGPALEMFELYISMRDSLNSTQNQKALIQREMQFEYEKEKVIIEKENERKRAIAEKEKEKEKVFKYSLGIVLFLVVLFLIFIFNRLKITRQKNSIIEEQKGEVDKAFSILEEKNQEITDSITYAKRIQSAILPSDDLIKELMPSSFVFYKPKDIIAGDFYWLEPLDDSLLFAVADCTGHGVPGAMVSVVSINALNRSVRELGKKEPGEILDQTRKIVIQEFGNRAQGDQIIKNEVKDGMDIALCRLKGNTLTYAGAYNPLWIIRNNEILEFKADRQAIGLIDNPKAFKTVTVELEKGDTIYLFSDGFADQFGGERGKKYKYKPFKNFLISLQEYSMKEQKELLLEEFVKWRGNLEQVDDVCMMGIRF
ncbi:MAG: tetratricopeptide repeat protein [Fluviicola sp.]|nr:tetratricopeptide repeat protein [Fluviicola sp.]